MHPAITAIGTANPVYQRTQQDIATLIAEALHLTRVQRKLLTRVYNASGIEQRHSVLSDYCKQPGDFDFFPNDPLAPFPSTAERMAVYQTHAFPLAQAAIEDCLSQRPDLDKKDITHVITVSCTGMYAPGLDIEIVQHLNLNPSTRRTAINFMGCYGAFNGMKVADAICRADSDAVVLMVCVELCSIHFQNNQKLDSIVANAIFADGAAAVIVQIPRQAAPHLRFESFYCDIMPQTTQEMAWHIADFGFEMVLTSYVPQAIQSGIAAFSGTLCQQMGLTMKDMDYFAIHPGGIRILNACETALHLTKEDNRFSYEVLRQYGNMSSATVLFVLRAVLMQLNNEDQNKKLFSCAFGPGLTLESMVLSVGF
jgi:alpha-pyrone synthase